MLYYHAMRELQRKASQLSRSIVSENRALGKAAKRITLCFIVLTVPLNIISLLGKLNRTERFANQLVLNICQWFAYVTFLANGFFSSLIFMLQNRPIRQYLRRVINHLCNRIYPALEAMKNE